MVKVKDIHTHTEFGEHGRARRDICGFHYDEMVLAWPLGGEQSLEKRMNGQTRPKHEKSRELLRFRPEAKDTINKDS